MRPRFLQSQPAPGFAENPPATGLLRDVLWDRPLFRPPLLPNPRVIFDPLPFRTQLANTLPRLARR